MNIQSFVTFNNVADKCVTFRPEHIVSIVDSSVKDRCVITDVTGAKTTILYRAVDARDHIELLEQEQIGVRTRISIAAAARATA